ncbi:MAG: redoxin domain-containing protein [Planctomycetota bacterium]
MTSLLLLLAFTADPELVALPAERPGLGEPVAFEHAAKPYVLAMTSTTCPLSRKFAPVLGRLSRTIDVVFVDVQGVDTKERFEAFAKQHGFRGRLVHDPERKLARKLGATTTTEVFLVDAAGKLAYRGAVSDQYGVQTALDAPRHDFLADAIAALRAGRAPRVRSTSAPGCKLAFESAEKTELTYHGRIEHIVQRRCVECHRQGGLAPFALETWDELRDHAGMAGLTVRKGLMPPWFAGEKSKHDFANDRSLTPAEKRDLLAWLKSDMPKGDPADAPKKRAWPNAWVIGKPDRVFTLPRAVPVDAEGRMPYVNVQVRTELEEDTWVKAWQVRPTDLAVVHHVLVFALPPGQRRPGRGELGGFFAAYVPGNGSTIYPDGFAKRLPKGTTLHFQLHYTPNGTATIDRTTLGIVTTTKPKHEVRTSGIANTRIRIPAGKADHEERAFAAVPMDVRVLALMPHMHFRGKAFRYELVTPAGASTTLLDVPRYDFNWQLAYWFVKPVTVAKGSRIEVTAVYDNSEGNPANPDPEQRVRWGDQSDDEMLIGYVEYYVPGVAAGQPVPDLRGSRADRLLARLDKNEDGVVSRDECPRNLRNAFDQLDQDGDDQLTRAELEAVNRRRR